MDQLEAILSTLPAEVQAEAQAALKAHQAEEGRKALGDRILGRDNKRGFTPRKLTDEELASYGKDSHGTYALILCNTCGKMQRRYTSDFHTYFGTCKSCPKPSKGIDPKAAQEAAIQAILKGLPEELREEVRNQIGDIS